MGIPLWNVKLNIFLALPVLCLLVCNHIRVSFPNFYILDNAFLVRNVLPHAFNHRDFFAVGLISEGTQYFFLV